MRHGQTQQLGGVVAAAVLLVPALASAFGQVTEPVVVKNARRGQVIQQALLLNNRGADAKDEPFGLSAQGAIAAWVKFYRPSNLEAEVTEVPVPRGTTADAIARITVPDTAANGTYRGAISVALSAGTPAAVTETGVTVARSIARTVEITVTDQEDIRSEVSIIPKQYDLKPGEVLTVTVAYRNQGNTQITPQVQAKVRVAAINGAVLVDTIFPYPESAAPVTPLETGDVTYTIATNSLTAGKYRAELVATYRDVELGRGDFLFTVNAKAGEDLVAGAASGTAGNSAGWWLGGVATVAVAGAIVFAALQRKRA